jgi:peroxiredoxin
MPSNKSEYMKDYYSKNKDKLKENSIKKVYCECCNKEISKANWNKHIKNKVHLQNKELKDKKNNESINENQLQDAIKLLENYKRILENLTEIN